MHITKTGKSLRCGYTTGTCATAATKASAIMLLTATPIATVTVETPSGTQLILPVHDITITPTSASCAIQKDSGDDPDITNGTYIYATVSKISEAVVTIDGGVGIGRVTKAGLDQPVGNAAINSTPRATITAAARSVAKQFGYAEGFSVIISAPDGEALATKTYNSRLGIVGGLSILGTTGIVEPMSEDAIIDTIYAEINVAYAAGTRYLVLTPGNYGQDFIKATATFTAIKCSNYIGLAIDYASNKGFAGILLIGHAGKFLKLACGMFNTHSKFGDCRAEVIATFAALAGADTAVINALLDAATADQMISIITQAGVAAEVLENVMARIKFHLDHRVNSISNSITTPIMIEAIMFTDKFGVVGTTSAATQLLSFC
ncbi:cobalt-precorrin-5B (C(1))-methyltransferase CbiD [Candidatus Epulonipiscium viviparus]|uniref:cobalt-precorrin-5B (C(1))-methyltransferase CbiD n=1 Tax=Candidatus Epulonipiscium viviparus TaxID=420336 RepID=UPI0027380FF1|nr:cobalt-precorrin-5B (C(1))-methyltransferase CbiD [Candidatus Epulopiscium viviparus]